MNEIPIYLLTNQKHHWLIPGFVWLFQKYWGIDQKLTVFSYGDRDAILNRWLPSHYEYFALGRENAPANLWSNGVLRMLDFIPETFFILFLEDYWLNQPVDIGGVESLYHYVTNLQERDRLLRLDLTADRASKGYTIWGRADKMRVILSNRGAPYQMSFQAGIWNGDNLRQVIQPAESPWEAEINGTKRFQTYAHFRSLFNLGTLDYPVRYRPVYRAGKQLFDLSSLTEFDRQALKNTGMLRLPKGTVIKWD